MNAVALPPHDEQAESGVLGCVLLDPKTLPAVRAALRWPEAFYLLSHRDIYEAILALDAAGKAIDTITIAAQLRASGKFEHVGGLAYLSELPDKTPSAANLPYYMRIVRAHSITRRETEIEADARADLEARPERAPTIRKVKLAELSELYASAGTPDSFPAFDDAAELTEASMPTPPAIVDGLLRRGEKCVIGGASKSFKSWAALDLGLSVSHGMPWLGRETLPGRVLFVNLELPLWCIRKRILDIANARGVRLDAGKLLLWTLRGQRISAEQLLQTLSDRKPSDLALIIVDPAYKLLQGRDENSAGDIAGLLGVFERMTAETGAAVVIPAHFAKGNAAGKESMDRISGSGVFARDPDSILTLTRHEEENAFTVEATLRTFPPVAPFVVKWAHPVFTVESSLDPERLSKRPGRPSKWQAFDLLQFLPKDGSTMPDWQKKAAKKKGVPRTTFYRLASELEADGIVATDEREIVRQIVIESQNPEVRVYADK